MPDEPEADLSPSAIGWTAGCRNCGGMSPNRLLLIHPFRTCALRNMHTRHNSDTRKVKIHSDVL